MATGVRWDAATPNEETDEPPLHCVFWEGPPPPLLRLIRLIFGVNLTSGSIDPDTVDDCIDTYLQSFLSH